METCGTIAIRLKMEMELQNHNDNTVQMLTKPKTFKCL